MYILDFGTYSDRTRKQKAIPVIPFGFVCAMCLHVCLSLSFYVYVLCFSAITIIIVVERANWRNHMMSNVS